MDKVTGYWPAWVAIAVATIVLLNQAITESKKFASALGKFGLWWYDRSRKRYQMDQIEFSTAVRNAITDERKKWEEDESRALTVVTGQMDFVARTATEQQKQLAELSFQMRCMTAYVEYEAEWHHKLRMKLLTASGSVTIDDLPDHMHYSEFERNCREHGDVIWQRWKPKE
jgi:hypothetical protein